MTRTQSATSSISDLEHHDLAQIFPMAGNDDLDGMVADMRENGYDPSQPIILYEGKILDGRNRQAAALLADVTPTVENFGGDDPLGFVIQHNLHRRHMTTSERAMVGDKLREIYDRQAKERQKVRKGNQPGTSVEILPHLESGKARDQVGKTLNVSGRLIDQATKVRKEGTLELQEAVNDGQVSVSDAAKVADKPAEVQRRAVASVKAGKARTVAKAVEEDIPFEDDEPKVQLDRNGSPFPPQALTAVDGMKRLNEICRDIRNLIELVRQVKAEPVGLYLDATGICDKLEKAKGSVLVAKPTHVCGYCLGKDHTCKACKGNGWQTSTGWNSSPKGLQEQTS